MKRRFWKLTAAGNDFVLLEGPPRPGLPALARRLCDRRLGIGADGLLLARRVPDGLGLRYLNADGSAAFCGNGARCAAWWAFRSRRSGRRLALRTSVGPVPAEVTGRERVRLDMPPPRGLREGLRLAVLGRSFLACAVDTGVPHAVIPVRGLERFPVEAFGPALRRHPAFGRAGANVDFMERRGGEIRLRTFERGVEAETWACGTGATAAALAAWRLGWARPPVTVVVRGGQRMRVGFRTEGGAASAVRLEGPARIAFQGEVEI